MRLAVIAVFLNEELHLPSFLESLGAQQRASDQLLLVDDGSSDRSLELAQAFAREHPNALALSRVRRPPESDRLASAAELKAFSWGVEQLAPGWDVVAKLDGDLILTPQTFAEIERRLDADPGLGIAGAHLSVTGPDGRQVRERSPRGHVRGATKFYRRECFEQVCPLAPRLGWDTLDEVSARMRGWRTEAFAMPDGDVIHLRPTATQAGALRGCRRTGVAAYAYGAGPLWALLSALRRMRQRPRFLGGLSYLYGWTLAALRSDPRADAQQRAFVAREHRTRLCDAVLSRLRRSLARSRPSESPQRGSVA